MRKSLFPYTKDPLSRYESNLKIWGKWYDEADWRKYINKISLLSM